MPLLLAALGFYVHFLPFGIMIIFGIGGALAFYCHAPAVYLVLCHLPSALNNTLVLVLVQWLIWFAVFAAAFALAAWFRRRRGIT